MRGITEETWEPTIVEFWQYVVHTSKCLRTFINGCFTNWTIFSSISTFNVKEFQIASHAYTIFCRSTIWFISIPRCILWGKRKDFFITIKLKCSFTCCIRNTNPIFVLWDLLCFWVYLIDYFNTVWFPKFSIILDTIFFCFKFSSLNSIKKVTCTSNRCIVRIINGAFCTLKQECLILIKYIQNRMVSTKTIFRKRIQYMFVCNKMPLQPWLPAWPYALSM